MSAVYSGFPEAWDDIRKKAKDAITGQSAQDYPNLKKAASIAFKLANLVQVSVSLFTITSM